MDNSLRSWLITHDTAEENVERTDEFRKHTTRLWNFIQRQRFTNKNSAFWCPYYKKDTGIVGIPAEYSEPVVWLKDNPLYDPSMEVVCCFHCKQILYFIKRLEKPEVPDNTMQTFKCQCCPKEIMITQFSGSMYNAHHTCQCEKESE